MRKKLRKTYEVKPVWDFKALDLETNEEKSVGDETKVRRILEKFGMKFFVFKEK